jgi:hypothetical protein
MSFPLQRRWAWWRLDVGNGSGDACSARLEVEEGAWRDWVGRLAAGPIGPEAEKNPFEIKI